MTAIVRALTALIIWGLALAPLAAWARPVAVTLYPDSAVITEEATLQLEQKEGLTVVSLALPAAANAASLQVVPDPASGLVPADVSLSSVERRDEGRIRMIGDQLAQARAKLQNLTDKRSAHEGAAAYWRSLGGEAAKPKEAEAMALAVRQGLESELGAASALARDIEAQTKAVAELQAEYERITGGSVRIQVAEVSLSGGAPAKAKLTWSYRLPNAGWTPRYTLNARPAKKAIDFSWDAEIRQDTGTPWADVAVTLATAEFRSGQNPPDLPPWQIRPSTPVLRRAKELFSADAVAEKLSVASEAPAPERRQNAVFDSYNAGKLTLESGQSKRLPLERATWRAGFDALVRPAMGPAAYTRATLTLGEAPRYPQGPASFLLDSALVRRAPFDLFSKETELFFGVDPQINVTLVPLARQSGTSGFLTTRNTHSWDWKIIIKNGKSIPVALRLEERIPKIGDERIELEKRLPGAQEEEDLAVWNLDMAPGSESTLEYGFTVTSPKDMPLDLGGR